MVAALGFFDLQYDHSYLFRDHCMKDGDAKRTTGNLHGGGGKKMKNLDEMRAPRNVSTPGGSAGKSSKKNLDLFVPPDVATTVNSTYIADGILLPFLERAKAKFAHRCFAHWYSHHGRAGSIARRGYSFDPFLIRK